MPEVEAHGLHAQQSWFALTTDQVVIVGEHRFLIKLTRFLRRLKPADCTGLFLQF